MLDDAISSSYCIGLSFPSCTPYEAVGIWLVILFYLVMTFSTAIHWCSQKDDSGSRDARLPRTVDDSASHDGIIALYLVLYFFLLTLGCLLWALAGTRSVHPIQNPVVQVIKEQGDELTVSTLLTL
jgi:hypothetical protein